jgi:hypothetical protein
MEVNVQPQVMFTLLRDTLWFNTLTSARVQGHWTINQNQYNQRIRKPEMGMDPKLVLMDPKLVLMDE